MTTSTLGWSDNSGVQLFCLGWLDNEVDQGGGSGGPAPAGRRRVILPPAPDTNLNNLKIVSIAALLAVYLDDESG